VEGREQSCRLVYALLVRVVTMGEEDKGGEKNGCESECGRVRGSGVTVSVSVGVSVGANVSVSAMGRNRRGGCTTGVEHEACIDVGM
jgi:hypothetical protein